MSSRLVARAGVGLCALLFLPAAPAPAQQPAGSSERTGRQVYEASCIHCHGPDGRGAVIELAKTVPLPDFSDCSFASREPDGDWLAVAHRGGPARGFSPLMPAWSGTFSSEELRRAVEYIRTFCGDDRWPRGELNLPRPLVTGKAFPEDEIVVSTAAATGEVGQVVTKFIYERRFGPVDQFELSVPLASAQGAGNRWRTGVGDIALGYKRALAHNSRRGHIMSASVEVVVPSGRESRGLGGGVVVLEPFVTFAQLLPQNAFVQAQGGFEIPAARDHDTEAFWRAAVGRSFEQGGFGRTWSPMIELLGSRGVLRGAAIDWDVVPQVQVTLNRRQHIRLNGGVRMPVTDRSHRSSTVIVYLLWDWFDGGFLDGW